MVWIYYRTCSSSQIAFLKTTIPIIYLSDTTYDQLKSYYPNLNKKTIINDEDASLIERKAIEKATVVSFPSKWAMDFCRNYYRLDFDKLVEIPWGLIYLMIFTLLIKI